ncbi:subtilisin family serine protease [Paenibacillus shirakamiensis]|uniref:Subtilisin family serine protease n=1 Tax=Paenibacillus shirakamiensis TaxID=1265935 RepID=A0ABS4JP00_9BACL|nr:S8 family peptidase [Paenibacillus shirakamiensis]MBP2002751.1 subtilisin family serine protease [Paenibacillus shirakamiensis]
MDYAGFLNYLHDQGTQPARGQRSLIRFIRPEAYQACLRELNKWKSLSEPLQQIRTSTLLHAFICPFTIKQVPDRYGKGIIIEKDVRIHMHAVAATGKENTPSIPWGVRHIHAPEVWSVSTGHQIRIGVIDTGADFSHPDLRHSMGRGINLLNRNLMPHDDNGHGTHIAGTIAAAGGSDGIIGVAPRAAILPVKAFDHNGSAYVSDIILGIDWCVRNQVDIINMSFGMRSKSKSLLNVVNKALQAGIVIVASAGNDTKSRSVDYPARYTQTISVGATDRNRRIASFSNRGAHVDIYAPGEKIYSAWLGGKHKEMNGTSMATSHVSGAIALLLAHRPGISPAEIKQLLRRSARPLAGAGKSLSRGGTAPAEVHALRLLRRGSK